MLPSDSNLRILLLGNGGREHAIAWKLSQSPLVSHIYAVPGNGGLAGLSHVTCVPDIKADDFEALAKFGKEKKVNLLIPGPEAPLVEGVVDYFHDQMGGYGADGKRGIRCFGPSKAAARMEGSKTFSKDFMQRHGIPTARYKNFTSSASSFAAASAYIESESLASPPRRVVIKASGLAGGKGVIIPTSTAEAITALREIMLEQQFGKAGDEVVVEEFLEGDELSVISFVDGSTVMSLPPAQDHKRVWDGDRGPNTGGMGTYAPTNIAGKSVLESIQRVQEMTVMGMRKEGFPFVGVLFTGFMMTQSGPKVLEYNVRFGDPETQSLLPLMKTDLAKVMLACTDGKLHTVNLEVLPKSAVTVVVAAGGYPGSYAKGTPMRLDDPHPSNTDTVLFHAGTSLSASGELTTSGGRVIASTAVADTLEDAVRKAYEGVKAVHFEGMQFRTDIAGRALKK
ncbi:phosphoribosylamine-glycine ligase [Lepidopterella palustris CBS 459.81]|uniref:phosphoribosylamine--glycine ligase n=1 Tax=Lepidopterella palustris CBS 459.81 TaxID=1314670 RepID=A0A8E2EFI1_9PEZI|nr:phosphoribosylamine-glycine ligase [Lepidopterella palustris CBS 459.81]